ncbi:hypothetical protein VP01_1648g2 [Puccinia sorghi]|uniref:Uncharacterized protein n=1 Tax=Puccinia sorghi TaxID=27349 RepID=A0A0L6VGJ8_9BASI|nr:hypothetical protein VP01_1648g2 [Puccinia sorghi]
MSENHPPVLIMMAVMISKFTADYFSTDGIYEGYPFCSHFSSKYTFLSLPIFFFSPVSIHHGLTALLAGSFSGFDVLAHSFYVVFVAFSFLRSCSDNILQSFNHASILDTSQKTNIPSTIILVISGILTIKVSPLPTVPQLHSYSTKQKGRLILVAFFSCFWDSNSSHIQTLGKSFGRDHFDGENAMRESTTYLSFFYKLSRSGWLTCTPFTAPIVITLFEQNEQACYLPLSYHRVIPHLDLVIQKSKHYLACVIVPNFMNKMPTIQKEAWIVGMG